MSQYYETIIDAQTGVVTTRDLTQEEIDALNTPDRANFKPLSRIQAFLLLEGQGVLSESEVEEAIGGNRVPDSISAALDSMVTNGTLTAAQKKEFRLRFLGFQEVDRLNPMLPILFAVAGQSPTDGELDVLWDTYLAL